MLYLHMHLCGACIWKWDRKCFHHHQNGWQFRRGMRTEDLWNFPHVLTAKDGKHVLCYSPSLTPTIHLYKLMLYVKSSFPGRNFKIPYVFLRDEALALTQNFMKPFSATYCKGSVERIFNYRLSRARWVVENVFVICSAVFGVLRKPMLLEPEKSRVVVMTIIYLHNFLRKSPESKRLYRPPGTFDCEVKGMLVEGNWRQKQSEYFISLLPIYFEKQIEQKKKRNVFETDEEYLLFSKMSKESENYFFEINI
ncbi:hypothetical protein NQ318_003380 [Aromia moschata]|uniref:DDE Tnp4 domain-containing protein n=1 Tax=Aromia moschata TaxID=1265417 RepID=A0AAV8Y9X7_9CUCU|nr:hypothetical protein NQ318_003380 [Aromia moschata]